METNVIEVITKALLFHLAIAAIVGALGSVGTSWLKSMFKTENRWFNLTMTIGVVYLFAYIIVIIYGQLPILDFVLIGFYANLGAKALYEAVDKIFVGIKDKEATRLDGTKFN